MIFTRPPSPLEDTITQPGLRAADRWSPALDQVVQAAATRRRVFLAAARGPLAWQAYLDSLSGIALPPAMTDLGEFFGMAFIKDNAEAAQAILLTSGIATVGPRPSFLKRLAETLYVYGRMDLFRPALFLLHDFCLELWRRDAPERIDCAPPLRSKALPDPVDLTATQYNELASHRGRLALRGARTWLEIGTQVSGLLKIRSPASTADLGDVYLALADAMETMPSLRPFSSSCLIVLGQALLGASVSSSSFPWLATTPVMDTVSSFSEKITDFEAPIVIRHLAAALSDKGRGDGPHSNVHVLAKFLVASHPALSLDQWMRLGPSGGMHLPSDPDLISISLHEVFMGRKTPKPVGDGSLLMAYRKLFLKKYLKENKTGLMGLASSYDQVALWVGPSLGHELSQDTRMALDMLVSEVKAPLLGLRSALDKARLSSLGTAYAAPPPVLSVPVPFSAKPPRSRKL